MLVTHIFIINEIITTFHYFLFLFQQPLTNSNHLHLLLPPSNPNFEIACILRNKSYANNWHLDPWVNIQGNTSVSVRGEFFREKQVKCEIQKFLA